MCFQVHKISNENGNSGGKMKVDGKQTAAEKPRQLFWEKRLSGLRASYPDEEYQPFLLPGHFKPMGPGVKNDVLLASISTNIHMNNGPIHGQSGGKVNIIYFRFKYLFCVRNHSYEILSSMQSIFRGNYRKLLTLLYTSTLISH